MLKPNEAIVFIIFQHNNKNILKNKLSYDYVTRQVEIQEIYLGSILRFQELFGFMWLRIANMF